LGFGQFYIWTRFFLSGQKVILRAVLKFLSALFWRAVQNRRLICQNCLLYFEAKSQ
jgi:hypothetical protein